MLYALTGIAAWLVWRTAGFRFAGAALTLYLVQLAVNAPAFWRIKPLAGALLFPCLLWVSFAAVLNYSLWQLNPQVLA